MTECNLDDPQDIMQTIENEQNKIATQQQRESAQHSGDNSDLVEGDGKVNVNSIEENRKRQNIKSNENEQDKNGVFSYEDTDSSNHLNTPRANNGMNWYDGVTNIILKLNYKDDQIQEKNKNFQRDKYNEYNLTKAHSILSEKWQQKFQDLSLQKQQSKPPSYNYVRYINEFFHENKNLNDKDEDYLKALEFQEEELAEYFKELEDEEQANHKSKSYNHS